MFQFVSLREKEESHLILGEERERDRLPQFDNKKIDLVPLAESGISLWFHTFYLIRQI
jgi:hypothetical protein